MDERPYLQTVDADLHEAWYCPMGFSLRIVTNRRSVIDAAEASFRIFGDEGTQCLPDFSFRFYEHEIDDGAPKSPIFRTQGPLVYQTTGRDSVLVADRENGLAYGYFSRSTLNDAAFFRWHFLDLAFFFMLEWRKFVGVHGAALCKNGKALLLRAPSGHGKTTLAYAGARSRFQALAEDVVWIDVKKDLWWGLPSPFHLLSDAKALFPEVKSIPPVVQLSGELKLPVDVRDIRPDSTVTCGQPGPVVMLRRVPGGKSRLERLSFEQSYEEWLTGCATKEQDAPDYSRHVASLLNRGAYRLDFGDDIDIALDLLEPLFE